MCPISLTARGTPVIKVTTQPPRWPARGRIRKPKCMTRKGSTRRRGAGSVLGRHLVEVGERRTRTDGRTSTRRHPAKVAADTRGRMAEPRSVVITGASRGLGLRIGGAALPRRVARGRGNARTRPGYSVASRSGGRRADDDRLIGVQLDLLDPGSIAAAAKAIEEPSARRTRWCTTRASPPREW